MSFWDLSDGGSAAEATTTYDSNGGDFELIPNGSYVLAIAEKAVWKTDKDQDNRAVDGTRRVSIQWSIMKPESLENRKVFHNLWVDDFNPYSLAKGQDAAKTKRNKDRTALATIDANAGGNLTRTNDAPTDETLSMHLCNKPMVIVINVMETANPPLNWVAGIKPADTALKLGDGAKTSVAPAPYQGGNSDVGDDEIPF